MGPERTYSYRVLQLIPARLVFFFPHASGRAGGRACARTHTSLATSSLSIFCNGTMHLPAQRCPSSYVDGHEGEGSFITQYLVCGFPCTSRQFVLHFVIARPPLLFSG